MAKNMPAPWMSQALLNLIKSNDQATGKAVVAPLRRPKVVQVLKVYEKMGIIVVNDKKNSLTIMLSKRCLLDFNEMYNSQPLSTLNNSMVKLENWHFSTVIQCAGPDRELRTIATQSGITLPIAISCSRLTLLGAYDCVTIGEPVDLNSDPDVRMCLREMNYITLVDRLACRQFPLEKDLPDSDGYFSRPALFNDENPLRIAHCEITTRQLNILRGERVDDVPIHEAEAIHNHTMTETLTETEVDNCFDMDMEIRSERAIENHPHSADHLKLQTLGCAENPASISQSQHTDAIPTPPRPSLSATIGRNTGGVDSLTAGTNDQQQALFTQNFTQESTDNIERWLLHTVTTPSAGVSVTHLSAVAEEDSQNSRRDRRGEENTKEKIYSNVSTADDGTGYSVSSDSAEGETKEYGRSKLRSGRALYSDKAGNQTRRQHEEQKHEALKRNADQIAPSEAEPEILTQPQVAYVDSDQEEEDNQKGKVDAYMLLRSSKRYMESDASSATSKRIRLQSPSRSLNQDTKGRRRGNAHLTLPTQAETSYSSQSEDVSVVTSNRSDVNCIIGQKVKKKFVGFGWYTGKVTSFSSPFYTILYDDGDREELELNDLVPWLVSTGAAQVIGLSPQQREEGGDRQEKEEHHGLQLAVSDKNQRSLDCSDVRRARLNQDGKVKLVTDVNSIATEIKRMPIRANAPNAVKAAMLAIMGKY